MLPVCVAISQPINEIGCATGGKVPFQHASIPI